MNQTSQTQPPEIPPMPATIDLFQQLIECLTLGPAGESPHHLSNYRAKIDRLCQDGEQQIKRDRAFQQAAGRIDRDKDKAIQMIGGIGQPAPIRIVIEVEGGNVQAVISEQPIHFVKFDYDTQGACESDYHEFEDNGETRSAFVRSEIAETNPERLKELFQLANNIFEQEARDAQE